jgi:lantibiotic modifying enzyme
MEPFETRYIPNTFSSLLTLANTKGDIAARLATALDSIVMDFPPRDEYDPAHCKGIWAGPTGLAYLFFHASTSSLSPSLIRGKSARQWAIEYLRGQRELLPPSSLASSGRCGIGSESLCYPAVCAAVNQDMADVRTLLSYVPAIVEEDSLPDEMLHGRAGTLYLLRLVLHRVDGSEGLVEQSITQLSEQMIARGPEWTWRGHRYLGAVHGDVGIITQLVTTTPSLAPRVEAWLARVLEWQQVDEVEGQVRGNWPTRPRMEKHGTDLVQFCHGAPGFLPSLWMLKQHFPNLRQKIDQAQELARECVWKYGLLRKEPSLCHGIFGSAL